MSQPTSDDPLLADLLLTALDEQRDRYWASALDLVADMLDHESAVKVPKIDMADKSKGVKVASILRNAAEHLRRRDESKDEG